MGQMQRMCCAFVVGAALGAPATTTAAVITYTTTGVSELDGQPIAASATFTTSNGAVSLLLENLVTDPKSVIQNISGVQFSVTGATSGSLTSSSGTPRTITKEGTFSDGSAGPTDWLLRFSDSTFNLTALGSNGPDETIIGAPNGSNAYGNANGSIAGNQPHNAFLAGPATFVLAGLGITDQSVVSNVILLFGTGPESLTPGCPAACAPTLPTSPVTQPSTPAVASTPEPTSLILLGSGLIAAASRLRKRRA